MIRNLPALGSCCSTLANKLRRAYSTPFVHGYPNASDSYVNVRTKNLLKHVHTLACGPLPTPTTSQVLLQHACSQHCLSTSDTCTAGQTPLFCIHDEAQCSTPPPSAPTTPPHKALARAKSCAHGQVVGQGVLMGVAGTGMVVDQAMASAILKDSRCRW